MKITHTMAAGVAGACLALGFLAPSPAQAQTPQRTYGVLEARAVRTCEVNQDHGPGPLGPGDRPHPDPVRWQGPVVQRLRRQVGWYHRDLWEGEKGVWMQDKYLGKC